MTERRPHIQWVDPAAAAVLAALGTSDDLSWQDLALCAETDPDAWFPEKGTSTKAAKKICMGCEVRAQCLEYALEHEIRHGVWGGKSEHQRRNLRRGLADAA